MKEWYEIENVDQIDSPALAIYKDRVAENIELVKNMVDSIDKLRPHVKTNKMSEVCQMMMDAGIKKYKAATITELKMLAMIQAPDILLAYQPVGPKIERLIEIVEAYPKSHISCLVDNFDNAKIINDLCAKKDLKLDVYIDLNVGMNRTGIDPKYAIDLAKEIKNLKKLNLIGIHGYDGHVGNPDLNLRQQESDQSYAIAKDVLDKIQALFSHSMQLVLGGTPPFALHAKHENVECSPGTFVFWDWGYKHKLPEMPFQYAAVLITRVISVIDSNHICTDLGHKSIAAENSIDKRVRFLGVKDAEAISQSEEHLVLQVPNANEYKTGDVLYAIPVHICPTVALYEKVFVIENNRWTKNWNVIARNKYIKN